MLPPVRPPGLSAVAMQLEGCATAINRVRALEHGRNSKAAPRSDIRRLGFWTARGAPRCRAPNSGSSLSLVELERWRDIDVRATLEPLEPVRYRRRSTGESEPPAVRAVILAVGRTPLPLLAMRRGPSLTVNTGYAAMPRCRPPHARGGYPPHGTCSLRVPFVPSRRANRRSGSLTSDETSTGAVAVDVDRGNPARGLDLSPGRIARREADLSRARGAERASLRRAGRSRAERAREMWRSSERRCCPWLAPPRRL